MLTTPNAIINAWSERKGPLILTTVDTNGTPNSIYATCTKMLDDGSIVVADNYFKKTQENILAGSKGSILFITNDGKAYQVKGKIEYHKEGAIFDDMKSWNPKKHPGHAAAVLRVEDAYSGAEKLS